MDVVDNMTTATATLSSHVQRGDTSSNRKQSFRVFFEFVVAPMFLSLYCLRLFDLDDYKRAIRLTRLGHQRNRIESKSPKEYDWNMPPENPYQPPAAPTLEQAAQQQPGFLASLIPATLAMGLTLPIWVVLVLTLTKTAGNRFAIQIWSSTLLLSATVSIVTTTRLWHRATNPFAFAAVFSIFCIVFAVAEGDTTNGEHSWHTIVIYGTLICLPILSHQIARYSRSAVASDPRHPIPEQHE